MKVADEMIDLYGKVWHETPEGEAGTRRRAALQAVLDLIDPVPEDVDVITDIDGDTWHRYIVTTWRLGDSDNVLSIQDLVRLYGSIAWEGKK